MAVEWADGFDTYTGAQQFRRYVSVGPNSPGMVAGYGGGQAVELLDSNRWFVVPLTQRSTYIFGFVFYSTFDSNSAHWSQIFFSVSAANSATLLTIGGIGGTANNNIYINGTAFPGFLTGGFQFVAVKVVQDPVAGAITVMVDGNQVYAGTGLNLGSSPIASIKFIGVATGGSVVNVDHAWAFNTLGLHSNVLPTGRVLVPAYNPSGDGSLHTWTPSSAGAHYLMVHDAQSDDDATYVSNNVPGGESFSIPSLSGSGIAHVHALVVTAIHRKDDINVKILHVLAKSGANVQESGDINVPTAYTSSSLIVTDDPNTGAEWAASGISAAEIGVKEIS